MSPKPTYTLQYQFDQNNPISSHPKININQPEHQNEVEKITSATSDRKLFLLKQLTFQAIKVSFIYFSALVGSFSNYHGSNWSGPRPENVDWNGPKTERRTLIFRRSRSENTRSFSLGEYFSNSCYSPFQHCFNNTKGTILIGRPIRSEHSVNLSDNYSKTHIGVLSTFRSVGGFGSFGTLLWSSSILAFSSLFIDSH